MKIEKKHKDYFRKQFAEMQTKQDLLVLLSEAKDMLYGEKTMAFQLKSLTYYANPKNCKKRYKTFTIKKKSGKERTINAPVKGLKSILKALNFVFQCIYEPNDSAMGFVIDKSIVDNAKKHVGNNYVYNLDLKDFFHSFDLYRVKFGILKEVFGIHKLSYYRKSNPEAYAIKEELAFLIASLTTHPFEIDDKPQTVLPQGSPTSPTLTNILCKNLDRRLNGLAKRFNVTYTRYADDITFSSSHNIYNKKEFQDELKRIIEEDQKFAINPQKTRLQKECHRQKATGLVVNDKVNVKRGYVKQIRMYLYYWEKYGIKKATEKFKIDYNADKSHVKNMNAKFINVLEGKLLYLKMVKGVQDGTYIKLKNRFDKLVSLESPINKILDIWEKEGIGKAMELYYNNK